MNDRQTDLPSRPSSRPGRSTLLSARKFALMASVVAGLGIAGYGVSPHDGSAYLFSSPAQPGCFIWRPLTRAFVREGRSAFPTQQGPRPWRAGHGPGS